MSTQIQTEHFTGALITLLDETFDNVHGIFLDKGTSLFETLATISSEEASIPVGGKCATLAAQERRGTPATRLPNNSRARLLRRTAVVPQWVCGFQRHKRDHLRILQQRNLATVPEHVDVRRSGVQPKPYPTSWLVPARVRHRQGLAKPRQRFAETRMG